MNSMTNKMVAYIISMMLMSCSSLTSSEQYFCSLQANDIRDVHEKGVKYNTYLLDGLDVDQTYDEPQYTTLLVNDTLSKDRVIAWGNVKLSHTVNGCQTVDSVALSCLIIHKKGCKAERYSSKHTGNDNFDKAWSQCPLSKIMRRKIREDFFLRMKNRRYHLRTNSHRRLSVAHEYRFNLK